MVELQSYYQIKKLRSDRDVKHIFMEFQGFCEDLGLKRQLTVAYSPLQNDVAKRKNRTLLKWLRVCFLPGKCITSYEEKQLILQCIFSTDVQQKHWKIKHCLRHLGVES